MIVNSTTVSVNNKRIAMPAVKDGDNVVIGKTAFRFADHQRGTAPQARMRFHRFVDATPTSQ